MASIGKRDAENFLTVRQYVTRRRDMHKYKLQDEFCSNSRLRAECHTKSQKALWISMILRFVLEREK